MKIPCALFLNLCLMSCLAQQKTSFEKQIRDIAKISSMPYIPELSGDSLFWKITTNRKEIIPALINHIDDTASTFANVPNFGGVYTIGDVCIRAIKEIIFDFPTIKLIEKDSSVIAEKGFGVYWEYVRKSIENRRSLKKIVTKWYKENEQKLVWVDDERLYSTADETEAPAQKRPAGGYYIFSVNRQ